MSTRSSSSTKSSAAATRPTHGWLWGLLLVAAVHLLTTPGTWVVTDQAESLFTASRLLDRGTLDLAGPSEPLPEVPWAPREPGAPVRSRLLPGPAIVLAPLLWLDRRLGLAGSPHYGRLVNLQGLLCVLLALFAMGLAARRHGADDASAGLAVAATGLAWPTWQISRAGGTEPILAALVGLALLAAAASKRVRLWSESGTLFFLHWVNPSGSVLAAGLLGGLVAGPPRERSWARAAWLAGAFALGAASVALIWNLGYHGSLVSGGYRLVGGQNDFGAVPAVTGLLGHLTTLVLHAPLLVLPALVLCLRSGARQLLVLPAWLLASQLALFATYRFQEPDRRLAAVLPALGLALALGLVRARAGSATRQALLATAPLPGVYWFMVYAGRYYEADDGLFYPHVYWVKRAIDTGLGNAGVIVPVATLLLLAALAAGRLWRLQERRQAPTG